MTDHETIPPEAVKRNVSRFPRDFMFQLTAEESANLRSQIVISSSWGGRRTTPYAFTEQGVAMLSSVLRSDRAEPPPGPPKRRIGFREEGP